MRVLMAAVLAIVGAGCAAMLPAPDPMRSLKYDAAPAATAKCLVVFLPGAGDTAEVYDEQGFVAALRERKLSADAIAANATLGYYGRRTLIDRLGADVIDPARAKGYAHVYFVGISMGGLGTLLYAKQKPGVVDRALLLAPYLGDDELLDEIARAGGPAKWQPGEVGEKDYQRDLWAWLKKVTEGGEGPKLWLGFGSEDKLIKGHRVLEQSLPKERVFHTGGGHDWPPWKALWIEFLDKSDIAGECSP